MIRVLLTMLVKALLETACVLLAVAAVMLVFSFRIGRRLVTTTDDPLERLSARAVQLSSFFPRREPVPVPDVMEDEEYDDA